MAPLETRHALRAAHTTILVRLPMRFFSCDKARSVSRHARRQRRAGDHPQPRHLLTSKQVESLAGSDDARVPLAATREPYQRVAATSR
jgi:hypothetical protein